MNRILGFAAVTLTALMGTTALAQEKVVNVYNWSDYIDESILEEFTKDTGIKVVYDVFDSNEVLETKLLAGGTGYDVVVPTGSFLQRQITAGVFQKLDKAKLSNIGNMWGDIAARTAAYDPDNAYSINYMWGTTGLGLNVAKFKERMGADAPMDSWAIFFDPENLKKFADCGVHVLDAPTEVIPAALKYLGRDPNGRSKEDFEAAEELLLKVRPYIQKFHSSEYINALATGDICLALGWSGDVLQARDRAAEAGNGIELTYVIPKQGALMWFDQMAIPADAPHVEEAHAFINYIMKADVAAKASNFVYYANGNKASQPMLNEDVIGDPAIYPNAEAVANLYSFLPYDPKEDRLANRVWTKVKSGQ